MPTDKINKPLADRIGERYGCWTIIGPGDRTDSGNAYFPVRCECGHEQTKFQSDLFGYGRNPPKHCKVCRPTKTGARP